MFILRRLLRPVDVVEEYRRKWREQGYREELIDMAVELADNYAEQYAEWISRVSGDPTIKERVRPGLLRYALENVAEPWLKKWRT